MIRAAPDKYELLATGKLPLSQYASPAIADGKLYLRLNTGVGCFDLTQPATKPAQKK